MKNKLVIIFTAFLLILPFALAQVKVQLGQPYVNIKDFSEIEFKTHSDYYELCSLDNTVIPVLINNKNKFEDTFMFEVNKEYVSLPVKSAVLKSGKSAILPLTISPPVDIEENTTLTLDIITKKEGLKRSVKIKTNIKKCYLFDLSIDKDEDEICGCDKGTYNLVLENNGRYTDTFTLTLDMPKWINSTLTNETIKLDGGQKREIKLEASPPCKEKDIFTISAEAISEKTKVVLKDELELTVLPQDECYNTIVSVDNVGIDYFGKNIPVIIENKGVKDASYSLSLEGINWYTLSQTEFSLKKNNKKTINLALYPGEDVVEGSYNIDIKAKSGEQEFTKSIMVELKRKGAFFEKIKFYMSYFRYYIGTGVVLLVVVLLLVVFVKKGTKKKPVKEKPEEKIEKKVPKKVEEKKIAKKVKKISKRVNWFLSLILYLIFLALLVLLVYSTFKYRSYYEKALDFISGLFTNYVIPYASYLKYVAAGVGALLILLLIIDFFRKKTKKKRLKKEEKIKKDIVPNSLSKAQTKPKEEKKEVKRVSTKRVEKKKLKLFEYIYLILVILLFLAIAVYAIYRFSGKSIPADKFVLVKDFFADYFPYFIVGIVVLFILIVLLKRKEKKIEKKVSKKVEKRINKKLRRKIKSIAFIIVGLIVLSGVVYSFVYYGLIGYIMDFFVVYYPYILMGAGILIILILILHFQNKKIS